MRQHDAASRRRDATAATAVGSRAGPDGAGHRAHGGRDPGRAALPQGRRRRRLLPVQANPDAADGERGKARTIAASPIRMPPTGPPATRARPPRATSRSTTSTTCCRARKSRCPMRSLRPRREEQARAQREQQRQAEQAQAAALPLAQRRHRSRCPKPGRLRHRPPRRSPPAPRPPPPAVAAAPAGQGAGDTPYILQAGALVRRATRRRSRRRSPCLASTPASNRCRSTARPSTACAWALRTASELVEAGCAGQRRPPALAVKAK